MKKLLICLGLITFLAAPLLHAQDCAGTGYPTKMMPGGGVAFHPRSIKPQLLPIIWSYPVHSEPPAVEPAGKGELRFTYDLPIDELQRKCHISHPNNVEFDLSTHGSAVLDSFSLQILSSGGKVGKVLYATPVCKGCSVVDKSGAYTLSFGEKFAKNAERYFVAGNKLRMVAVLSTKDESSLSVLITVPVVRPQYVAPKPYFDKVTEYTEPVRAKPILKSALDVESGLS